MAGEREHTRAELADGFRALGVSTGGVVLLHSSLKSFGRVAGGAGAVIDGLRDALGPGGTLVVPTLTGHEALSVLNPPRTDLRTAPCWVGAIPETLRQRPGAVRSIHPTHSCAALGARAAEITRGHELSPTPCGITSPYFRVAAAGGYILFAGCGLEVCTTLHTVEELANVGYHLQDGVAPAECIDMDGRRIATPVRLHSYAGPGRDFPALEPVLRERGHLRTGRVGDSEVRLVCAMGLIETALDNMRFDPLYLTVERGKGKEQAETL
mgnify:CR=1 FL=1